MFQQGSKLLSFCLSFFVSNVYHKIEKMRQMGKGRNLRDYVVSLKIWCLVTKLK